jgi:hypothetical protein
VYELTSLAANVLIAEGIAMLEMRRGERRHFAGTVQPCTAHDRRSRRRRT